MSGFLGDVMRYVDRMGSQQWLWVLIGVMIVGGLCLRGFGSRSNY